MVVWWQAWGKDSTPTPRTMTTTAFAERLADLVARSAQTDAHAAQTLAQLQRQGQQVAAAMTALATAMEAQQ
jgi:hypothetical protein